MKANNNIVFLDLDGPAFPDVGIKYDPANRKPYPGDPDLVPFLTYWKMCDRFKWMWDHVTDIYDFKVVISSSWRKCTGFKDNREAFLDLFLTNGLELNMHDDWHTPIRESHVHGTYSSYYTGCQRASEIHYWIQNHDVKNYIILDDPWSGMSLNCHHEDFNTAFDYMKDSIVLVNPDLGIGSHDMDRLLKLFKRFGE